MTEIAVAFDVPTLEQAVELDGRLGEGPELAKVGLELFASAGPDAVRALLDRGRRVFLDLKLHDIPNTVRGAAAAAARLGAELLTVHAAGGPEMIHAAVTGVREAGGDTRIVAVTLLTSLDPSRLPPGFARPFDLHRTQADWLAITESSGGAGIVCSAADLDGIRRYHPQPFFAVTPGIRPSGGARDDQQRVATAAEAVRRGAGMIVIGRPVTASADPRRALEELRDECRTATTATR